MVKTSDTAYIQQTDGEIEQLLTRWTMGNDAPLTVQDCPALWQNDLASQEGQQLPLAALAMLSQYQALAQPAQAATPLANLPALPTLNMPTVPDYCQTWVNYIAQQSGDCIHLLLALLAQHGYSVSPVTWLNHRDKQRTNESEQVMEIYYPWQNWYAQRSCALTQAALSDDESASTLNADTWPDFAPAERLQLLHRLRLQNPDACRELIAECIAQETAERRWNIIAVLQKKLSENDLEFLRSLQQDRSKKVTSLVDRLLMQLGHGDADVAKEDLQEWVEMTEVIPASALKQKLSKALGKKSLPDYHITPKGIRNGKQRERYTQLLEQFGIVTLAEALGITVEQFVLGWDIKKNHHDCVTAFLDALAHIPDAHVAVIYQFIDNLTVEQSDLWLNDWLWQRLPLPQQQLLAARTLSLATTHYVLPTLSSYLNQPLPEGIVDWATFKHGHVWRKLKDNPYDFESHCLQLGLILPASIAVQVLDELPKQTDRLQVDPAFSSLRLNVALAKGNHSSSTSHTGTDHE